MALLRRRTLGRYALQKPPALRIRQLGSGTPIKLYVSVQSGFRLSIGGAWIGARLCCFDPVSFLEDSMCRSSLIARRLPHFYVD